MFFPGAHSSIPTLPAVLLAAPQNWNQNWLKKPAMHGPSPAWQNPKSQKRLVWLTWRSMLTHPWTSMKIRFCWVCLAVFLVAHPLVPLPKYGWQPRSPLEGHPEGTKCSHKLKFRNSCFAFRLSFTVNGWKPLYSTPVYAYFKVAETPCCNPTRSAASNSCLRLSSKKQPRFKL